MHFDTKRLEMEKGRNESCDKQGTTEHREARHERLRLIILHQKGLPLSTSLVLECRLCISLIIVAEFILRRFF